MFFKTESSSGAYSQQTISAKRSVQVSKAMHVLTNFELTLRIKSMYATACKHFHYARYPFSFCA